MDVEGMLFELHADICKAMASPRRIQIIMLLREGEMHVDELASRMETSKGNVSQHLAILREKGIVASRKEGLNVFYRLDNPKIVQACDLMREVMLERLADMLSTTQKLLQLDEKKRDRVISKTSKQDAGKTTEVDVDEDRNGTSN